MGFGAGGPGARGGLAVALFGNQVSGSRFRVLGFGFRVPDSGLRVPGFGFRVSGFGCRGYKAGKFAVELFGSESSRSMDLIIGPSYDIISVVLPTCWRIQFNLYVWVDLIKGLELSAEGFSFRGYS